MHTGRIATRIILLCTVVLLLATVSAAQNFVYFSDGISTVYGYQVSATGVLTPVPGAPFATGGNGAIDYYAANQIAVSSQGFVFVSNAGSRTIASFAVNSGTGTLTAVPGSPFTSTGTGYTMSMAVTPNGNYLFASNGAYIETFAIGSDGELSATSTSLASGDIDGIAISPNGAFLAVTPATGGTVYEYSVNSAGALSPVSGSPFTGTLIGGSGGTITNAAWNCASNLLYNGVAQNPGMEVVGWSVDGSGVLTPLPGSPYPYSGASNSNVAIVSTDGAHVYETSQDSDQVLRYDVAGNGSLTAIGIYPTLGAPTTMAVNSSNNLFVATDSNIFASYMINADGSLTQVQTLSQSSSGGVAVYPANPCTAPTLTSISVSPTTATIAYGGNAPFTATGNYSNGSTQNLTSTVTWTSSNTAVATVSASGGASAVGVGSANISATLGTVTSNSSTLTVNQAATSVSWTTPAPIIYGTALSATQLNATSGGIAGAFVYSPALGTVLAAGSQTLSVTFTPANPTDYTTVTTSVSLTVTQALLTVTANNLSRNINTANPAFTYTVAGYVNGNGISVVTGAASCSSTATTSSPAGSYPITCTTGTLSAQNYTFGLTPGTLSVLPGLVESNVSVSPASPITSGTVITVSDTATNNSVSSTFGTVLYYFSTTTSASGSVYANRSTGLLGVMASSSGTTKITVPSLSGSYYLVACLATCSSTPITIVPPPPAVLAESNVSVSPASPITSGTVITVSDTVTDSGSAGFGTVLFYFSTTTSPSGGVYGNRSTGLLAVGASSSGTTKITVPGLSGSYYLVACLTTCSSTPITIVPPPPAVLAESNVSVSPASPITHGTVITVSDTVTDSGSAGAGTVLFYFSPTTSPSGGVSGNRSTGLLAVGASSSGTTKITVPGLSGSYYLVACVTTCSSTPITIN